MLGRFDAPTLIAYIAILLFCFPVHELAHAWVAVELGDDTPRRMGRLTLNPLAHLDFLGSLLLLTAGFGWAKPVQVNPYNFRGSPRLGMAVVAAAGPASNFVMALIAAIPFRLGLLRPTATIVSSNPLSLLSFFLIIFILVNLSLMLFNLIPIAPLDGSKILRGLAPREWDTWLNPLEQYGPMVLMLVFFVGGRLISFIITTPANFIFRTLLGL